MAELTDDRREILLDLICDPEFKLMGFTLAEIQAIRRVFNTWAIDTPDDLDRLLSMRVRHG